MGVFPSKKGRAISAARLGPARPSALLPWESFKPKLPALHGEGWSGGAWPKPTAGQPAAGHVGRGCAPETASALALQ